MTKLVQSKHGKLSTANGDWQTGSLTFETQTFNILCDFGKDKKKFHCELKRFNGTAFV